MYLNFGMGNIYIHSNEIFYEFLLHYTRKIINGENMTNLDQGQKNVFSTAATFWYATIKRKEWVYFQLVTAASPLHCPSYKLWYTKKKKRNYKACSYKIIVRRENLPAAYYQKNYFSCCQLIYI